MTLPAVHEPSQEIPLKIVGGNNFGRYNKISDEKTLNMLAEDDKLEWLVSLPGYKRIGALNAKAKGRIIYNCQEINILIAVEDNVVFRITVSTNLQGEQLMVAQPLFELNTQTGLVSVAENIANQIAICDTESIWIYNFVAGVVTQATLPINTQTGLPIKPGYVIYHNGYFVTGDLDSNKWYLSDINIGLDWLWGSSGQPVEGAIQTKPGGTYVASIRMPGQSSNIINFGKYVAEIWNNTGGNSAVGDLFPYQKNTNVVIDYGLLSASTLSSMDRFVGWLAVNEKSSPVIMILDGFEPKPISDAGIDYKLADVKEPAKSTGFFYKERGHILYQLTFYGKQDNFTLVYDLTTGLSVYASDENQDYHIAQSIVQSNNTHYFVSLNDGYLYDINSNYHNYDYTVPSDVDRNDVDLQKIKIIPRIRILPPFRLNDASRFQVAAVFLTMEQGEDSFYLSNRATWFCDEDGYIMADEAPPGYVGSLTTSELPDNNYIPIMYISVSADGANEFSNEVYQELNAYADRLNRVNFYQLGSMNEFTLQIRIYTKSRVAISNGVMMVRHNTKIRKKDVGGRRAA